MDAVAIVKMIAFLCGGLAFFLYGMNVMSSGLEKMSGGKLEGMLRKSTSNKLKSVSLGAGITVAIQSSSAVTVMLVGLVNSGIMVLGQTIGVIMGSNIGTTLTAWILALNGAEIENPFLAALKPNIFSLILALLGIAMTMMSKSEKKKDIGTILVGFAVLIYGMELMGDAMEPLKPLAETEGGKQVLAALSNPLLGVLVGAVFTGIIQSSAASVGILMAFARNGFVTFAMAAPIVMGQNIGTCVTAMIASVGTNKNAKRTAFVHLMFNVIGTVICLTAFCIVKWGFNPSILNEYPNEVGIATCHSAFNIITTIILFPCSGLLAKFACFVIRDKNEVKEDDNVLLDEKLITVPAIALERSKVLAVELGEVAIGTIKKSLTLLEKYDLELAKQIKKDENTTDMYEDILGKYLVKLSSTQIGEEHSLEVTKLLKAINDFERIGDHAINVLEAAEELKAKDLSFSDSAKQELAVLSKALNKILDLTLQAFTNNDLALAENIEPLEEVIDNLKEQMRARHVIRMQQQKCSIEVGFVWVDLLTSLERVSDHCSNIAIGVIDTLRNRVNSHEFTHTVKLEERFKEKYAEYSNEFKIVGTID